MKLYVKFDFNKTCRKVLDEQLNKSGIPYELFGVNEIQFKRPLSKKEKDELTKALQNYFIEPIENKQTSIVQRIKSTIDDMLFDPNANKINSSDYLSDKLHYSYTYLSTLFSEATYSSIEHYIILRKVDFVKEALINTNATLTEIAYKFNYSSVAHLSGQFKKTTGLSPSLFQRIIKKRNRLETTI
ncbi:MAG: helix-turn-helix transcriptional regulator [Flavobacteriaceae bacterium]|nr:helix-turn-helix transcriptional regulator [Flavobacteriaceae bacterium]